ncbi:hypothetical protein AA042_21555 [Pseudomonas lundensis]|nr:hypothetical protein AA042_21555 [Pseudomonas lundensis]
MSLGPLRRLISLLSRCELVKFIDCLIKREVLLNKRLRARISRTAEVDVASGGGGEAKRY